MFLPVFVFAGTQGLQGEMLKDHPHPMHHPEADESTKW